MVTTLNINIKTIPHKEQRYETVGDWWFNFEPDPNLHPYTNSSEINPLVPTSLEIRVSDLGDPLKELCVSVHELVESVLCTVRDITQKQVDEFDKQFEANREPGNTDEPGDHPRAPYKREHCFATGIERLLVSELGLDWKMYEETINSL